MPVLHPTRILLVTPVLLLLTVLPARAEDLGTPEAKAEKGDDTALLQLGRDYATGHGVARDDAKAAEYFKKAAEAGNVKAQLNLGLMYAWGRGVAKDTNAALEWLRKAAGQGDVTAQLNLGATLARGKDFPKDLKEAAAWLEKAARQGSVKAANQLGQLYYFGDKDWPIDYAAADQWFEIAVEKGDPFALNITGIMAEHGTGMEKDIQKALQRFRLAAEQGMALAQANAGRLLGTHYEGIKEDHVEAYKWLALGTEQGEPAAENFFKEFQYALRPKELAEAKRQIEEYKQRHPVTKPQATTVSDTPTAPR